MPDVGLEFADGPLVEGWTTFGNTDLNNGSTDTSGPVDLGGAPVPMGLGLAFIFNVSNAALQTEGDIEIHVMWSHDGVNFDNENNMQLLAILRSPPPFGADIVSKNILAPVQARYLKFHIINNAGGAIQDNDSFFLIHSLYGYQV